MSRYERCECGDTWGKHDDNGECRVKTCDCIEFRPVEAPQEESILVHTSYGGQ